MLRRIIQRYGKNPAQIVLRWLTQQGICAIPKPVHEDRIPEIHNIADFSFDDMHDIRVMIREGRSFLMWIRLRRLHIRMGYLMYSD